MPYGRLLNEGRIKLHTFSQSDIEDCVATAEPGAQASSLHRGQRTNSGDTIPISALSSRTQWPIARPIETLLASPSRRRPERVPPVPPRRDALPRGTWGQPRVGVTAPGRPASGCGCPARLPLCTRWRSRRAWRALLRCGWICACSSWQHRRYCLRPARPRSCSA